MLFLKKNQSKPAYRRYLNFIGLDSMTQRKQLISQSVTLINNYDIRNVIGKSWSLRWGREEDERRTEYDK